MDKKSAIGIGILAAVGITGGMIGWLVSKDEPVNVGENVVNQQEKEIGDSKTEEEKYVGEPVPNIINRAGTVKKVKKDSVVINGPDDEDIVIYIDEETKIYGADGSEKYLEDIKVGMYITADIDGDLIDENAAKNVFDAMIIYISGK